jgi:hypothetical protein
MSEEHFSNQFLAILTTFLRLKNGSPSLEERMNCVFMNVGSKFIG